MSEFGELLRHARAYKGVSLREVEKATRINRHHLAALEREEFEELPPLIYARGIVRNYAQYLGLDPVAVLALFEEAHGQRSGGFRVVPAVQPLDIPSHWAPNFAIIAFMVVMSAVIFAWMYSAYFAPKDSLTTTPTSVQVAGGSGSGVAGEIATQTPEPVQGGGEATPAPTPSPTATPPPTPTTPATPEPTPTPSSHTFAVTASERVWVEVTVDGQVVYSSTIAAGETQQFEGQQMHVVSGNARYVRISVDGVDQGLLGETWDADATYPKQ